MHRDYKGNAHIKFYQYPDRIEIINHGGLYGKARPENFPTVTDYRNPAVAEGMQILGYVNMLNHGIAEVQREMLANGNGEAIFSFDRITVFEAKLMESEKWQKDNPSVNPPVNEQNRPINPSVNERNPSVNTPVNLPLHLQSVFSLIKENSSITYSELAKQIGKNRDTIRIYIKALREDYKLIKRAGSDKNGHWIVLNLPEELHND